MKHFKYIDWCQWKTEDREKVEIMYWDGSKETITEDWDTFKSKIDAYWKEHGREE